MFGLCQLFILGLPTVYNEERTSSTTWGIFVLRDWMTDSKLLVLNRFYSEIVTCCAVAKHM